MRRLFLILFAAFPVCAISQYFTLQDSVFRQGDRLVNRSVTWELSKAELTAESFPFLDSLASFLLENATISLEIGHHTDTRYAGQQAKSSTNLSAARAASIRDYR